MDHPAKVNSTPEVPDFSQQQQRMTIPVAGEDAHDSPPPYEAPRPAAGGGGGGGPTSSSTSAPVATDSPRSSTSSHADEHAGFLDGFLEGLLTPRDEFQRLEQQKRGYRRTEPMSVEQPTTDLWDDKNWDHLDGRPGCCFSDTGGCFWSSRGGCCFSDRGGGCMSDRGGFAWSDRGGFCFSDRGGCFFSDHGGCFFSSGRELRKGSAVGL